MKFMNEEPASRLVRITGDKDRLLTPLNADVAKAGANRTHDLFLRRSLEVYANLYGCEPPPIWEDDFRVTKA